MVNSGNVTFKLDSVAGLAQTNDGGYVIAGTEAILPNDEYETISSTFAVLFRTDSLGNILWNQGIPSSVALPLWFRQGMVDTL